MKGELHFDTVRIPSVVLYFYVFFSHTFILGTVAILFHFTKRPFHPTAAG